MLSLKQKKITKMCGGLKNNFDLTKRKISVNTILETCSYNMG